MVEKNDNVRKDDKRADIPIWKKLNLTIEEAAAYSNIGVNKLNAVSGKAGCPFVLYVGRKKLIKRKEFENYMSKAIEL